MSWKRLIVGSVFVLAASTNAARALQMSARIDVEARGNAFDLTDLKACPGTSVVPASWLKEKAATRCTMTVPVGKDWKQIWLEFVPSQSGKVIINIMGGWVADKKQRNRIWVWTDDVEVTGVEIKNGGFEETKAGKPAGWTCQPGPERYNTGGQQAHSGQKCVKVSHDSHIWQTIEVEAGKRYRVSAWFRSAGE